MKKAFLVLLLVLTTSFSNYEEIFKKGDVDELRSQFAENGFVLKIETDNLRIKESVYSNRQAGFIIGKFFKNYGFVSFMEEKKDKNNGNSLLIEKYLMKDRVRNQDVVLQFSFYYSSENNKTIITKLLARQIE